MCPGLQALTKMERFALARTAQCGAAFDLDNKCDHGAVCFLFKKGNTDPQVRPIILF